MKVHQITPSIIPGDAISNHILEIDGRLQQWGYDARIYAQHAAPELENRVHFYTELQQHLDAPDDLFIYHYGIYHHSVNFFRAARGKRLFIYHNITPAYFFAGWDKTNERICRIGRMALGSFNDCDLALGDSDFNRRELVDADFAEDKTGVLPIFLTLSQFENQPSDTGLARQLRQPGFANWLTVGRVVPSKAIEDVIRLFFVYNKHINPDSRLYIVGSDRLVSYRQALAALVEELGLQEQVQFSGRISPAQFKTYYECADLYVTASRHEGFCVPLIESMYFNVPILARDATAIPETLGDAGILFTDLGYAEAAQMAHIMISDTAVRQQIIAKQQERLEFFAPDRVETILQNTLLRLGLPDGR